MARLQASAQDRFLECALMFARTCNIACRHCGIESSPQNKSRMTLEDARRYILDAATIPAFRKITFTGGEPFLFQDEHADLIALASGLGLFTRVVTNGFWASSVEKGIQLLRRMKSAGLGELNFSADRFHLEFLKAETLRNALAAAAELGYPRILSFVTNTIDRDPLDELSEMYGLPREQLLDLQPLMDDLSRLQSLKHDHIFVFAGGLIGLGRAASYPQELRYFPFDFFPDGRPCGEVVNKPVIYPDGDFQACCCAGGKIATFTVGNAKRENLQTLYERMLKRSHYRFINEYGPKELYRAIHQARPDLPRPSGFTSVCEMCVKATEGLSAPEVDAIVEGASFSKLLCRMGFAEEGSSDAGAGSELFTILS